MTEHLTDEQLAEIRDYVAMGADGHLADVPKHLERYEGWLMEAHGHSAALLAEVTRLRAESEQRLGELLFWEFEYRDAMDNYRGEAQHAKQLRAELVDTQVMRDFNHRSAEHIAGKRDLAETAITSWSSGEMSADAALLIVKKALATAPACTCRAEAVHQAGCDR